MGPALSIVEVTWRSADGALNFMFVHPAPPLAGHGRARPQ